MKIEPSPLTSPPTDDEIAAARTVVRLNRHLAHALAKVDLTEAQYRVLALLAEGDEGASGIAGQIPFRRPTMVSKHSSVGDVSWFNGILTASSFSF